MTGNELWTIAITLENRARANTACTRTPATNAGAGGGSLRVFWQFSLLEVGSIKVALSRPAHPRVTQTVRRLVAPQYELYSVYIQ